jgi:L-amino acid N-acyltransferase YncA
VTGVRLRPATAADLAAVIRIWREGWVDGHEGHVPEALAAERTPASFDERVLERISSTWVAESGGTVAGFVVVDDDEVEQVYGRGPRAPLRARGREPMRTLAAPGWQIDIVGKGAS